MNNKTIRTDLIKFSISIAVVVTVALFAIGSIVASVNAQPSNFTIKPSNLTAGGPVLNCASGISLTLADIQQGKTCPSSNLTSPTPTPAPTSTPAPTPTPAVTKPTMITYKDPQGRFSISYPTSWTVTPAQNRFEGPIVKFEDTTAGFNLNVNIITGLGADPETASKLGVSSGGPFGYSLFQDVECTKYKVDGQKACSTIYTKEAEPALGVSGIVAEQVLSYVNGSMYAIDFGSPPSLFDSTLPTFETMLHSFKVTSGNSTFKATATAAAANETNTSNPFGNVSNVLGNVSNTIASTFSNMHKTITSEQCNTARHMSPTPTTSKGENGSFGYQLGYTFAIQGVLKACQEAGK